MSLSDEVADLEIELDEAHRKLASLLGRENAVRGDGLSRFQQASLAKRAMISDWLRSHGDREFAGLADFIDGMP